MPTMLDAEKAEEDGAEETAHFHFEDVKQDVTLKVRKFK